MKLQRCLLCVAVMLLIAGPALADTGQFSSFSASASRTGDSLDFDLQLATTGSAPYLSDDWVRFVVQIRPTAYDQTTCNYSDLTGFGPYQYTVDYRGAGGDNQFSASFSYPGIEPTMYKWVAYAYYSDGEQSYLSSSLYNWAIGFVSNTFCPFLASSINSGSSMQTFSNQGAVFRAAIMLGRDAFAGTIPTVGTFGLMLLGVLLATAGVVILRRM